MSRKQRTLNDAIDDLVMPRRILLFQDENGQNIRGDVPSLIQQLENSTGRASGAERGGKMQSRPPISIGVHDLLNEISHTCKTDIRQRGGQPAATIEANLRRIAADRANQPTDSDDTQTWIRRADRWAAKARAALGLEPKYPQGLRGVPCPECGTDYITSTDDTGEQTRILALQFAWADPPEHNIDQLAEDRRIRAVECAMCGRVWWSGPQLWQLGALINHVIEQNLTHETLGASNA